MTTTRSVAAHSPLLDAALNLSRFHREHEKFTASSPRERAVILQRHARTLHALADQWSRAVPSTAQPLSPSPVPTTSTTRRAAARGVLFMEGEGEPAELAHLIRDLRTSAEDFSGTGDWLANAMQASWDIAAVLVDIPGLEDLLGDRHRIIANDWLASNMSNLIARLLVAPPTSSTRSTSRLQRCVPISLAAPSAARALRRRADQPRRRPLQRLRRPRQ